MVGNINYIIFFLSLFGSFICWEGNVGKSDETIKGKTIFPMLLCLIACGGFVMILTESIFDSIIFNMRIMLSLAIGLVWLILYIIFLIKINKYKYISEGFDVLLSIISSVVILFYPIDIYLKLFDGEADNLFVWSIPLASSNSLMLSCYFYGIEEN